MSESYFSKIDELLTGMSTTSITPISGGELTLNIMFAVLIG